MEINSYNLCLRVWFYAVDKNYAPFLIYYARSCSNAVLATEYFQTYTYVDFTKMNYIKLPEETKNREQKSP